ncbi:MAG: glycoside hydrolase family 3 C-terminal domain-containing protein [Oscillospiraceae bacterium]|jgi:beta-glucosidase|nr:glycoside hydrolase family 3 C-terminal domain-containing protein [Oscillospiraceae bacterium]
MNIQNIISQMTLEEKASLCSGLGFWETKAVERLGVPSIMMTDGPHGLRKQSGDTDHLGIAQSVPSTCFPPAVLSACSFDRELLREMGEALGDECVAEDVRILLGPGTNIKRSPLCGRNFEYFSEDPYLSGEMTTAHIKGVQSKGIGTSLKHYAANNQETRRFSSDSRVDERTLHEIFFPAFKKAVQEAQPATVMCSYNRLNGEYASENHLLLTEILRGQWGFEGIVVSDWGAVNDRVKALAAGLELEMPSTSDYNDNKIIAAVKSGQLEEAVLDLAVERLLNLLERVKGNGERTAFDKDKHNVLARKIAAESMVLLKNDGLLPLKKDAKIAFIGEFAEKPRYQGAGSSQVNPITMISALDGAAEYAKVTYCKGYSIHDCEEANPALEAEAVAAAKAADICVLFAGLPPAYESEGFDREHMRLPGGHVRLIEAVAAANPKLVVILYNGAPVEMPWAGKAGAILEAYLGGQAGGGAVADILFGASNPCGKLAESFPKKLSDNPSYLFFGGEGDAAEYREGIFVGYRYYDTKEMDVLFPFGHGLSYTAFTYSKMTLSAPAIDDTEMLTVTVDVTNTGKTAGKEIVQLYIGPMQQDERLIRAQKELRGFEKVFLQPGETKTVSFVLDKSAFSYYNTKIKDFHVLSGAYRVIAARSSRDIALETEVNVSSTVQIPFFVDVNTPFRDILRLPGGPEFVKGLAAQAPMFAQGENEPGSLGFMFEKMMQDMNMRSLLMMGKPGATLEGFQAMLDAQFNQ